MLFVGREVNADKMEDAEASAAGNEQFEQDMNAEPQMRPKVRQEVGVPLAAVTDQTVGEIQQQLQGSLLLCIPHLLYLKEEEIIMGLV